MITEKDITAGSHIQLANGDIVRIRNVAGDTVSFEYENRAVKTDQPFLSAAYLRVDAPPETLSAAMATTAEATEYVNPVVTCNLRELVNATVL